MIHYYLPKLPAVSIHKFERPVTGWKTSLSLQDGLGRVLAEINISDNSPREVISMLKGPLLGYLDEKNRVFEFAPVFESMSDDALVIEDYGNLVSIKEIKDLISKIK
jgi:hypothetical protein